MESAATESVSAPQPPQRKLAYVRVVLSVDGVPDTDKLDAARVDGWQVVVPRGSLAPGDAAAFVEADALLPVIPLFEFLRPNYVTEDGAQPEGFRVKKAKVRGVLSEGVLLPLHALGALLPDGTPTDDGADLTAALRVVKWVRPEERERGALQPHAAGAWPPRLRKTDQTRLQAPDPRGEHANVLEAMRATAEPDETFEVTLKLDGTSCTAFHDHGDVGVCSRNLRLKTDGSDPYARLGLPVAAALAARGLHVAIQGEIMGPKIGGNREKLGAHALFVFDVWDIDAQAYWTPPRCRALVAELGLRHVPVIHDALRIDTLTVDAALALARRRSLHHDQAEGVVFKSNVDATHRSFKAINPAYDEASNAKWNSANAK